MNVKWTPAVAWMRSSGWTLDSVLCAQTWTGVLSCPRTERWPSPRAAGCVSWWSTWTEPPWYQKERGTSSYQCPLSEILRPSPRSPDTEGGVSEQTCEHQPWHDVPSLTGTLSGYLLRILADSMHRCSERETRKRTWTSAVLWWCSVVCCDSKKRVVHFEIKVANVQL